MGSVDLTVAQSFEALKGWGGWSLFFLAVIAYFKTRPDQRRAETEHEQSVASGQALHIKELQAENAGLRDRIEAVEQGRAEDRSLHRKEIADIEQQRSADRRECRKETEELRAMVRCLEDKVQGLVRDITQHSRSTAVMLDSKSGGGE